MISFVNSDTLQLAGQYRRFGEMGLTYRVLLPVEDLGNATEYQIEVLETGETLRYPAAQLINDPVAN